MKDLNLNSFFEDSTTNLKQSQKVYTVYQTTNLLNNMIYVGIHETTNPNDGYLGSGKYLERAIKKYGREHFKKDVLFIFDNEQQMRLKEEEIVDIDFVNRDDTYNFVVGGRGGYVTRGFTPEQKKEHGDKISKAKKEKCRTSSKETRQKRIDTMIKKYGSSNSQQFANVELQSQKRKAKWDSMTEEEKIVLGIKISEGQKSLNLKGELNKSSIQWVLISPTNEMFVTKHIEKFCDDYILNYKSLRNHMNNKIDPKYPLKIKSLLTINTIGWCLYHPNYFTPLIKF